MTHRKSVPADRPEAAMVEAAGLRWLAEPVQSGGAAVVQVRAAAPGMLELEEIVEARPDPEAAEAFGAALAITHRSLAEQGQTPPFGALPAEHPEGVAPFFGPAEDLRDVGAGTHDSWGAFHAAERIDPLLAELDVAPWAADVESRTLLQRVRDRIASGALDDDEPPARIHGDLWAGNVLWRAAPRGGGVSGASGTGPGGVEAVLIDPAAHAGHREADLAMLQLFGLPHLDRVMQGYQRTAPLRDGVEGRVPLHQLFPLLAHWALFGPGYAAPTLRAAESVLRL
ncbi:fructosamine kinase family protein [Nesterenkonia sp. F]|uniref:fructosamine kinase family protein n=1 Tax=Nesterenkonia sp. F TaxID=795955 RepID=UPI000255CFA3|nr:fructosamine kinase family protein [Nesterenkonia sp. F]